MRLSTRQKAAVLAACVPMRPDARLVRVGDNWGVVWFQEIDPQTREPVPAARRWRAQLVSSVDAKGGVWWVGVECIDRTRRGVTMQLQQLGGAV